MAIDFPNAPTVGQIFTSGGQTWKWNGASWDITSPTVGAGYLPLVGGTITGSLAVTLGLLVGTTLGVSGVATFSDVVSLGLTPTAPDHATTKQYVDAQIAGTFDQQEADARYLKLTGGTMTGNLTIDGTAPSITFIESDQATNLKRWLFVADNAALQMLPRDDAGATTSSGLILYRGTAGLTDVRMAGANVDTTPPTPESVLTQARGDNRYLRLTGGTLTGNLYMDSATGASINLTEGDQPAGLKRWMIVGSSSSLQFLPRGDGNESLTGGLLLYRDTVGLTDARLNPGTNFSTTTPPNSASIITMGRGDARYLNLTGGTMTGALRTVGGNAAAPGLLIGAGTSGLYPGTDAIAFSVNGVLAARVAEVGTAVANSVDIITQEKGDARYLRLTGGTVTGSLTVEGGSITLSALNATSNVNVWLRDETGVSQGVLYWSRSDDTTRLRSYGTGTTIGSELVLGGTTASVYVAGATRATFSSSGLDVAGAVDATGNLYVSKDASPGLHLRNVAEQFGATVYTDGAGILYLRPYESFASPNYTSYIVRYGGATSSGDILRMTDADSRYLKLSGGTLTGGITAPANGGYFYDFANGAGMASSSNNNLALKGADDATNVVYYGGAGGPATATSDATILSRKMADARYAAEASSITAGNGLTGGGTLASSRTITMGTPGSITSVSTNSVTTTSHTHALTAASVLALVSEGGGGALGTYALARFAGTSSLGFGSTTGGSNLNPANAGGTGIGNALSGTWQNMGYISANGSTSDRTALFLRIS